MQDFEPLASALQKEHPAHKNLIYFLSFFSFLFCGPILPSCIGISFKSSKFSAVSKKPLPILIVKETESSGLMTSNIVLIPWFQNSVDSTMVPWNQYDVYCNKNMGKQILI